MIKEHISVSDPKFDELDKAIRESYPNCCIVQIQKVTMDKNIEENFLRHYERFTKINDKTKIVQLYHGCSVESVNKIIHNGFLISENVNGAFGIGTYFSNSSFMSQSYAYQKLIDQGTISYIIVADVVISDVVLGSAGINSGNKEMLEKDRNWPSCYVNRKQKTSIFCIPYDSGAIPRYIISFHKETNLYNRHNGSPRVINYFKA